MQTLVNEWECDLCHKIEKSEQQIPDEINDLDDLPPWIVLELPEGWARDLTNTKEYCAECWETVFEMWMNGIDEDWANRLL